jgi:hypothetical protein
VFVVARDAVRSVVGASIVGVESMAANGIVPLETPTFVKNL